MELQRYLTIFRRWWWLLVIGTALAGASAYLVSRQLTPIYEASTTLLINQAPASSATPDYNAILTSERLARTYAELMLKRPVLEAVIADLDLATTPADLAGQVRVTPLRDTQLIVLTVEDPDPQQAAAIANGIATVFGEQNRSLQAERFAESKRNLTDELAKLQADIDATGAELATARATRPVDQAEVARLQEAQAQYRSSYATVLRSLEEVRLAESQQTNSVTVAEAAAPAFLPVRPRTATNTLLAAVVGLLLVVGLVLLFEYLNDRIASSEDVAAAIGAPTLAAVGRIDGTEPTEKLVTIRAPHSVTAEAYQMLRVRMEINRFEQPIRSLLVTSCGPGEGKSTTAANLAASIARTGKRVILVDTDLRRPSLHRFFRHANLRGFTTALMRGPHEELANHMQSTALDNLLFLPSGPLPADPLALLSSPRVAELLADLQARADLVIFDSPPLLAVADSTLLGHLCDATLLVVLAGVTRSSMLRRAHDHFVQSGIELPGVVLNKVTKESGAYYDHYYYYYQGEQRDRRRGIARNPFRRRTSPVAAGVVDTTEVADGEPVTTIDSAPAIDAPERRNGRH